MDKNKPHEFLPGLGEAGRAETRRDAAPETYDAALGADEFKSLLGAPVFYRTYSRRAPQGRRQTWFEVCNRTLQGLVKLGDFTLEEAATVSRLQENQIAFPSGRWLWVGGTSWSEAPENYPGVYNCNSTNVTDWHAFGQLANLAMMGCGTGAVLESKYIEQLPEICNPLKVTVLDNLGTLEKQFRKQDTEIVVGSFLEDPRYLIRVGDSRQGWVKAYTALLELSSSSPKGELNVVVDLSSVRPAGEPLRGFGGVSNPALLPGLFPAIARVLNNATGRKLNAVECCLIIDEIAKVIVAGNIRRSAGMKQGGAWDSLFAEAKFNLWRQDAEGNWGIDPERDALRMSNHSRVFHHKPDLNACINSVRNQYFSGEGAIQWAGEAVARANCDLLSTPQLKREFLSAYNRGKVKDWLQARHPNLDSQELEHRLARYGLNPCGEIIGSNFFCNLSEIHLNQIDPHDYRTQEDAFKAGALSVAALLNHKFTDPRYQYSRQIDPIVGVSFTGLFDFFVQAFGVDWLRWWEEGRPNSERGLEFKRLERDYLTWWRGIVHAEVWDYCDRHNLRRPNRCTTVQPSGSKSLLTGASPGWHPPKAQRFIRRITFRKNDPVALACIDYGYNVVPSQSDKDDLGNLLNDPFDPRCTEWLVEIPVEADWADLPGCDEIDISKFSALAQFDFYMQVQRHYTAHNSSATIELRESEIEALGTRIYEAIRDDEGYISVALLARFDDLQTFPRLPFEPVDKATYEACLDGVLKRRKTADFYQALNRYDSGEMLEAGPAGCDSDRCLFPLSDSE